MSGLVVAPFRALRFDPTRVGDPGAVWAPPYDVISTTQAEGLRARHPQNIVRITLPEPEDSIDRYHVSARLLDSWRRDGVLVRDPEPAVYVHRHRFAIDGEDRVRTGVWARVRLVRLDAGAVLPHERTMAGPKADRLALMRACRAQLSPVFMISSDSAGRTAAALDAAVPETPIERTEFPVGERHELARVSGPAAREIVDLFRDETVLIADGHHRYETALAYRDELIAAGAPSSGRGAYEFVMAHIVSERDPGLSLRPTHRVVIGWREPAWSSILEDVRSDFEVRRFEESELEDPGLTASGTGDGSFLLVARGTTGGWHLRIRPEAAGRRGLPEELARIGAVVLHDVFLPAALDMPAEAQESGTYLSYTRDAGDAVRRVRSGSAQAALLLPNTSVARIREAVALGVRLPAKTTFFWPKVPTGAAIAPVGPGEVVDDVRGAG